MEAQLKEVERYGRDEPHASLLLAACATFALEKRVRAIKKSNGCGCVAVFVLYKRWWGYVRIVVREHRIDLELDVGVACVPDHTHRASVPKERDTQKKTQ
jgi:hypothetical protein